MCQRLKKPQDLISRLLALFFVTLICLFYFSITHDDQVVGFLSDDAIYVLMAEMYSPWTTNTSPVLEFIRPIYNFPPLYPVLLGLLGVDTSTPALATNITTTFLLGSIMIFSLWVWRETMQYIPTLILPLILTFLPSTILLSQELWSEFLFMCFIYGAFLCLSQKQASTQQWFLAALLLALASLTRSIGISAIAAYCLLVFIRKPEKRFTLILTSITPFICWSLFRHEITNHAGYLNVLPAKFNNGDNSIHNIVEHLINQPGIMADSWIWLFSVNSTGHDNHFIFLIFLTGLFLFSLSGFLVRIKQRKLDAIFVPIYLCAITIWPYTGTYFVSRFLFPLLPLFIFYIFIFTTYAIKSNTTKKATLLLCLIVIGTVAYSSSYKFIVRAYTNVESELMPYRRSRAWLLANTDAAATKEAIKTREITEVLKSLKQYIPEQECVYAIQTPMVMMHAQRISVKLPSYNSSNNKFKTETEFCRYILATYLVDLDNTYPPFYPLNRIPDNHHYLTTPFMSKYYQQDEPIAFLVKQTLLKNQK